MKKIIERKNLSEVCKGLSDVCLKLANSTKDKKYEHEFIKHARVFKAFSKLFISRQIFEIDKEQEAKRQKEKKEIINKLNKLIEKGIMSRREVIKCLRNQ
ncbi:MAG: hypothetical protein NT030_06665 [Candidatus Saganbacteria bacterium]|nr:hypothetical protein [Candidatus Saganbacteria bacterium]